MLLRLPEEPLWDGWRKGKGVSNSRGQDGHYSPQTARNINYAGESFRRLSAIQIGDAKGRIVIPFEAISRNELYLPSQVWRRHPHPQAASHQAPGALSAVGIQEPAVASKHRTTPPSSPQKSGAVFSSLIQRAGKVSRRVFGEAVFMFFHCSVSKIPSEPH